MFDKFLLLPLIALFLSAIEAYGGNDKTPQADPAPGRLYAEGVPESGFLTLKAGQYALPMDAASGWTIEKMFYGEHQFGLSNGHYGTVLTPKGGRWWGTGHKEGGREVVHALRLTVDGKSLPVETDKTVLGERVELVKESTIWKFKVRVQIVLTGEHIFERTQMEALEDCELSVMYYFMHIFPPSTTRWLAQLPDGEIEKGSLEHGRNHQVRKNTRWVAQFDPAVQMGYLCYTPKVITGPGSASMIWDLERYHKYYLRQNEGQTFAKGDKLDYSVLVKAVPNENGDWKATKNAAARLMEKFPPLE